MKNRILILTVLAATIFGCTSDSMINDDQEVFNLKAKKKAVERPFKIKKAQGTFTITPVFDPSSCPALVLNATGEGNVAHMGLSTLFEEWCWSGAPDDVGTRSLIITAANGDELWATPKEVLFTSETTFEEVTIINGGTGRFKYATGEITEFVEIVNGDETGFFGTFTLRAVGTITY